MHVSRIVSVSDLRSLKAEWNTLAAGVPFLSWDWQEAWWRQYGVRRKTDRTLHELYTLCVFDARGVLAGVAPWYASNDPLHGRVLRFLGSGEVCSDYLTVMTRPGDETAVIDALADWLVTEASAGKRASQGRSSHRWDLLDLEGFTTNDSNMQRLLTALGRRGCETHVEAGMNTWRVELPESWEAYVSTLSKSHRKQVRRLERNGWGSGHLSWHEVKTVGDLPRGLEVLVELHQKRRQWLGEPGCFSSKRFLEFHREVMLRLLRNDELRLGWMEIDGEPVAAEYGMSGGGVWYAYQAGLDTDRLEEEPGRLAMVKLLQLAIERGYRTYDFLRGDEPYKAHWRATPQGTSRAHVVANRLSSRWRHRAWKTAKETRDWWQRRQAGSDVESTVGVETPAVNHDPVAPAPAAVPVEAQPSVTDSLPISSAPTVSAAPIVGLPIVAPPLGVDPSTFTPVP